MNKEITIMKKIFNTMKNKVNQISEKMVVKVYQARNVLAGNSGEGYVDTAGASVRA